jgi:hypothetical protein
MTTATAQTTTTAEAWGRIYAVLDHLTPGGVKHSMLNNAAALPAQLFPRVYGPLAQALAADATADRRLGELMEFVDPGRLAPQHTASEQTEFLLSYQKEKGA